MATEQLGLVEGDPLIEAIAMRRCRTSSISSDESFGRSSRIFESNPVNSLLPQFQENLPSLGVHLLHKNLGKSHHSFSQYSGSGRSFTASFQRSDPVLLRRRVLTTLCGVSVERRLLTTRSVTMTLPPTTWLNSFQSVVLDNLKDVFQNFVGVLTIFNHKRELALRTLRTVLLRLHGSRVNNPTRRDCSQRALQP